MKLGLVGEYSTDTQAFVERIEELGHDVYPPVWQGRWHFNADGTPTVTSYVGITNLERVDGVVLMPGWHWSREAKWELGRALELGKKIFEMHDTLRRVS